MYFLKQLSKSVFSMRFFRYCISGAITAIIFFGLIGLCVDYCALPVQVSTIISALLTVPLNFFLHKLFSFKSSRNISHAATRYIVAAVFSLMLNGIVLDMLLDKKIHYLIAQLIASPLLLISNYFVLWLWVFSENAKSVRESH